MLNVNNDNDVDPIPETKEILVRTTTKSPPPPSPQIDQISPEKPVDSPSQTEVKLVANEDDTISQETETDRSTNKEDSSDEDETKVYNIKMGKSLVVETHRKVIEDDEVFENIKNENKEVIENTQQIEKANGMEIESILVNKHLDHLRDNTPSPRSESPLWSYTLPAPSIFADDKSSDTKDDSNVSHGGDLSSEVSDLSDVPIKPFIQKRIPVDFKSLDETSNAESSMTSDIEDGYHGDKARFSRGALLQSLENHRDDFIENEFEFLGKLEDDDKEVAIKNALPMSNGSDGSRDRIPSQKNDVINELNSVIVNNKLETVIRKSETSEDIESAQKSCLSNFTIQTYSNHADVKTDSDVEQKNTTEPIESSVELVNDVKKGKLSEEDTNKSDDEVILRPQTEYIQSKRPSLSNGNLFKSPRVSRSDSFHSTHRNGSTENVGLTSRSSSYISLIGNRSSTTTPRNSLTNGSFIDSNRRKSSSELSIADSPSLQSLLVMKTILSNSRKNSLNVDNLSNGSKDNGEVDGENMAKKHSVEIRSTSPGAPVYDDSSKENSPQNKLSSKNGVGSTKEWKYQGPPAINLSTWGERPKSMIAIKTDSDYKFGVVSNGIDKVASDSPQVAVTDVPINSVKPASKPVNVILATPVESVDVPDLHRPIVRAVVKKVQPANNVTPDESQNIEIRRPSYEVSTIITEKSKPETRVPLQSRFSWKIPATFNNNTSAGNINLNKKVPTVRGFKADAAEVVSDKDQSIDSGYKSIPPTVVSVNSNKDSSHERPQTQPPPTVAKRPSFVRQRKSEEPNAVPFSQFTLRKTGLKEKIVGVDVDNNEPIKQTVIVSPSIQLRQKQEIQNIRPVTMHGTTTVTALPQEPIKQSATMQPFIQQMQKQDIQNNHLVTSHGITKGSKTTIPISHEPMVRHSVTVSSSNQNIPLRPKQEAQNNIRPITIHTAIPPPAPPPIIKQVPIVRGVMKQKSLPIAVEPRDALLDSIKNFNKNNLKKK